MMNGGIVLFKRWQVYAYLLETKKACNVFGMHFPLPTGRIVYPRSVLFGRGARFVTHLRTFNGHCVVFDS